MTTHSGRAVGEHEGGRVPLFGEAAIFRILMEEAGLATGLWISGPLADRIEVDVAVPAMVCRVGRTAAYRSGRSHGDTQPFGSPSCL